jgi:glycosyltransferase involved in cell wall biosynthesis
MSAGLCPVVTDVGGNSAVLGAQLAHRLVPSQDPESLATGWLAALTDRAGLARDAAAARARVVAHYGLQAMVERYQEAYLGRREDAKTRRREDEVG